MKVKCEVLGFERMMTLGSGGELEIKKDFNFKLGDELENTCKSPVKRRRLCKVEQDGPRASRSSPAQRSRRRWQTRPGIVLKNK